MQKAFFALIVGVGFASSSLVHANDHKKDEKHEKHEKKDDKKKDDHHK